jgi:hypothetical protein
MARRECCPARLARAIPVGAAGGAPFLLGRPQCRGLHIVRRSARSSVTASHNPGRLLIRRSPQAAAMERDRTSMGITRNTKRRISREIWASYRLLQADALGSFHRARPRTQCFARRRWTLWLEAIALPYLRRRDVALIRGDYAVDGADFFDSPGAQQQRLVAELADRIG